MKVKYRRYAKNRGDFLNIKEDKLVEYGLCLATLDVEWKVTQIVVFELGKRGKWRVLIYLRLDNATTRKVAWKNPHLESEIVYFYGRKYFLVLEFCLRYL